MHANLLSYDENDRFGQGIAGAVVLHLVVVAAAVYVHVRKPISMGDKVDLQGSISASMVSALPLPNKVPPVEKQVLAEEDTSVAPAPPKPAAIPPPKPTDVEVKAKTAPPKAVAPAPVEAPAPPKHAQPTPVTPKADYGNTSTQLASSTTPVQNGAATATILDKTAGQRYSYYAGIISRKVAQNWYKGEADPKASLDRAVTLLFDVGTDGTPENVKVETRSGSVTLDQSAMHALQRVDTFGPSPFPHEIQIEFKFVYSNPQ